MASAAILTAWSETSGLVSSKWFSAGWMDRALRVFTVVEPGEGAGALLLAANVFLLLTVVDEASEAARMAGEAAQDVLVAGIDDVQENHTKVMENSTDYSVQDTARHALFLPVSREAKYKAKTAIDTFFFRAGDPAQAAVVWVGTAFAFTTRHFALANVAFIVVWIAVTVVLARSGPVHPADFGGHGD